MPTPRRARTRRSIAAPEPTPSRTSPPPTPRRPARPPSTAPRRTPPTSATPRCATCRTTTATATATTSSAAASAWTARTTRTTGLHFYTTTDSEAACCGYSVETYDYYYLYASAQPGLVPFYRCVHADRRAPLHDRLRRARANRSKARWAGSRPPLGVRLGPALPPRTTPPRGDHLYTTSIGRGDLGARRAATRRRVPPGYVWTADCGGPSCTWPSPDPDGGVDDDRRDRLPDGLVRLPHRGGHAELRVALGQRVGDQLGQPLQRGAVHPAVPAHRARVTAGLWPSTHAGVRPARRPAARAVHREGAHARARSPSPSTSRCPAVSPCRAASCSA